MTRHRVLVVLETMLLVAGIAIGAWCVAQLVEARYVRDLPLPRAQHRTGQLPGDADASGTSGSAPGTVAPGALAPDHVYVHVPQETGSLVAKLDAPSVKLSATILEGTDDHTLSLGAGHIEDTPFPGEPGNVGIAGHRDTTFRAVRNLRVGDPLVVTTADRVFDYKITRMFVVEPEDVYVLDPTDRQTLTLVTCYPFEYIGHAPHRFIVTADLEREEDR